MNRKRALKIGGGAVLGAAAVLLITHLIAKHPLFIRGAVLTSDRDPARELPISGAEISLVNGAPADVVRSDATGLFVIPIPLQRRMRPGLKITLLVRHRGYEPLVLRDVDWDKLCIAHLTPLAAPATAPEAEVRIANVVADYSVSTTAVINVGSVVKTFQVVNTGNVPCRKHRPCSPDGKWKAASGSAVMDAGPTNEFRNARASCIAGPCPFTKIDAKASDLAAGSRTIRVTALDWSDTATFLIEAEVYKSIVSGALRQSYPVIFDRALTFTLPSGAEGVSIEAQVNGTPIVFPLGPALYLNWANCQLQVNKDGTRVYRCELKPGYRFA